MNASPPRIAHHGMSVGAVRIGLALASAASVLAGACSAAPTAHFSAAGGSRVTSPSAASPSGAGGSGGSTWNAGTGGLEIDSGVPEAGDISDPTTCAEAAQYKSYVGCDFWPTVVSNIVWSIFDYAVVVANAGATTADVTVTRQGQVVSASQVAPNAATTIYLPWVPDLKGPDGNACGEIPYPSVPNSVFSPGGAYHLVSSVPVTVYQFNALEYQGKGGPPGKDWSSCPGSLMACPNVSCFSYTNDASLLLPSTAMTGNYRITAPKTSNLTQVLMAGYIAVTAVNDNTSVTVYLSPSGNIEADTNGKIPLVSAGGQTTLTLNAGDVAELVGDPTSDHAGSLVKASAPVQIISGSPCADEPDNTDACDHLEQTVFPAETLGKHYFVTVPTAPRGNLAGHLVRFVGNVDGTTLTYAGTPPPTAPTVLNAGQVVDVGMAVTDFEVTGTKEFAVMSLMLGGALLDPTTPPAMRLGDPSQTNSVAVEQYRTKYVFLAPPDYPVSYIDVVIPMGAQVMLDGASLAAAPTPISSGFGVVRQKLEAAKDGAHVLTSSMPAGLQVIGYGNYTSYVYPGGLNLHAIAPPPPAPQ